MANDLPWMLRRLDILERAIAEMEAHVAAPFLDRELNPDVRASLLWARQERRRLKSRVAQMKGERE